MTRVLSNQKVYKRTSSVMQLKIVPKSVNTSTNANSHDARSAAKKLFSRFRIAPVYLYTSGLVALLVFVFLVIGGVSSIGMTKRTSFETLPHDGSVDELMYEYLRRNQSSERAKTRDIPQGQILAGFDPIEYRIERGDTISEIASRYGIRVDTIISYNRIEDVRAVQAGTTLLIPAVENSTPIDGVLYEVRKRDTLSGISIGFGVSLNPILDINDLSSELIKPGDVLFIPQAKMNTTALKRALGTLFIKPVVGRFTSPFGMREDPFTGLRRMHYGVDWANDIGTPVKASNRGTVSAVGENRNFGKYIVIDHSEQFQTLYAHLSSWSVREGERVVQGAVIGKVGNTGKSTGPHLHFAVYKDYTPVDPLRYVHEK